MSIEPSVMLVDFIHHRRQGRMLEGEGDYGTRWGNHDSRFTIQITRKRRVVTN